jgi:hypothetical protein
VFVPWYAEDFMHPMAPYGKRERREAQYQRQHGRDVQEEVEESLHARHPNTPFFRFMFHVFMFHAPILSSTGD